jgi:hypothetical protein
VKLALISLQGKFLHVRAMLTRTVKEQAFNGKDDI